MSFYERAAHLSALEDGVAGAGVGNDIDSNTHANHAHVHVNQAKSARGKTIRWRWWTGAIDPHPTSHKSYRSGGRDARRAGAGCGRLGGPQGRAVSGRDEEAHGRGRGGGPAMVRVRVAVVREAHAPAAAGGAIAPVASRSTALRVVGAPAAQTTAPAVAPSRATPLALRAVVAVGAGLAPPLAVRRCELPAAISDCRGDPLAEPLAEWGADDTSGTDAARWRVARTAPSSASSSASSKPPRGSSAPCTP